MKRRILSYRIPPGHRHTVIGSERGLEFITYTGDYRMFHGLMGSRALQNKGSGVPLHLVTDW